LYGVKESDCIKIISTAKLHLIVHPNLHLSDTNIPTLKDIKIMKPLGEGHFGKVYLGEWLGSLVALKKLKSLTIFNTFQEHIKKNNNNYINHIYLRLPLSVK